MRLQPLSNLNLVQAPAPEHSGWLPGSRHPGSQLLVRHTGPERTMILDTRRLNMVQLAQVLDERRLLHQMTQIPGISKHFGIVHESFPKQLLKEKAFASTLTGFVLKSSTKAFASQVNFWSRFC